MAGLIRSAGKYRSGAIGILKGQRVSHIAPPAKQLPQLMGRLFAFAGKSRKVHALIRAAVVHYEIEFIHPFDDGNGRIGRLWQHLILREYHSFFETVPFESVIKARQKQYYRVLKECDRKGDATRFLEFSLQTIAIALKETILVTPRRRSTQSERLSYARSVFMKRHFNRKQYAELFHDISLPTASRDLAAGVHNKQLRSSGEKNQTRYQF